MDYRNNYVPKKRKVNYKIVVPFVILVIALSIFTAYLLVEKNTKPTANHLICNLNTEESQALVANTNSDKVVAMKDFGQYGQSLGIFGSPFELHKSDSFSGRTMFMKNLCSDKEKVSLLGAELDNKIVIKDLEPGFYELTILNGFDRSRVISEEPIDEVFYGIAQNGIRKEVRIIANKEMFDTEGVHVLDQQYVFLEVKNTEVDAASFDVVIDPTGLIDDYGHLFVGETHEDYVEAHQMYEIAEMVQKNLESAGYRAKLSRDSKKPVDINGVNGRIHQAYLADAKYYVNLTVHKAVKDTVAGASVIYPNQSDGVLARTIIDNLKRYTDLPIDSEGSQNIPGLYKSSITDGVEKNRYTRELGGRFTGAGIVKSATDNSAFSKESNYGIEALVVELGYITNPQTYTSLMEQKEAIAKAISDAIAQELGIVVNNNDITN